MKNKKTTTISTKKTKESATAIPKYSPYSGPATTQILNEGDARNLKWIDDESVHLVLTSPPYFNLKKYNDHPSQMGDIDEYNTFHHELDKVWRHCYRVLVPGGRLICVVGDVCVARRRNKGRHHVFPLQQGKSDSIISRRSFGIKLQMRPMKLLVMAVASWGSLMSLMQSSKMTLSIL